MRPERSDRHAPSAVPYDVMPAYRATRELFEGIEILGRRVGGRGLRAPGVIGDIALERALQERATRLLLAAAEGGSRSQLWRRALHYQYAWLGTHDLRHLLDRVQAAGRLPPDTRLGIDALLRMAQQALTLAAGSMLERLEKEDPRRREARRRGRRRLD